MLTTSLDGPALALVVGAALLAGFTSGFAGFGTGLVASGLWFHVLPAATVPPLVALSSVAAQLVGLAQVRRAFVLARAAPFLLGGVVGVPLGVAALAAVSPALLKTSVGAFLMLYSAMQLARWLPPAVGTWGGRLADGVVGAGGGFLGGFAGLSGPLPVIWLQLRGLAHDAQRATYQPFNLAVLALACVVMWLDGQIGGPVLLLAGICLPATLLGAWLGAHAYGRASPRTFQRVVLGLLLVSGLILLGDALV